MRVERSPSYPVSIFVAGDYCRARKACQDYCDEVGLCVTISETEYVYTSGKERGVIVGLINYPRFPKAPSAILDHAHELAVRLLRKLRQESFSIQTPDETIWYSWRAEDVAIGMETRRAGTTGPAAKPRQPGHRPNDVRRQSMSDLVIEEKLDVLERAIAAGMQQVRDEIGGDPISFAYAEAEMRSVLKRFARVSGDSQ